MRLVRPNKVKPRMWAPGRVRMGHHLARGLVGYWPHWDGSSQTVMDVSGWGKAISLVGTAWIWRVGPHGLRIERTSSSNEWEGSMRGMNANTGTIMIGMEINGALGDNGYIITHVGAGSSRLYVYQMSDGSLYSRFGTSAAVDSGFDIARDVNYQFVITWNEGTYHVFVDGDQKDTGAYSGLSAVASTFTVSDIRKSFIDYAGIWSRALSASEVGELFDDLFGLVRPPSAMSLFSIGAVGAVAPAVFARSKVNANLASGRGRLIA